MAVSWKQRLADVAIILFALVAILLLVGCKTTGSGLFGFFPGSQAPKSDAGPASALWPMTQVGALLIFAGGGLLFITRLARGWILVGIGIGLCVLNYLLLKYLGTLLLIGFFGSLIIMAAAIFGYGDWAKRNKVKLPVPSMPVMKKKETSDERRSMDRGRARGRRNRSSRSRDD